MKREEDEFQHSLEPLLKRDPLNQASKEMRGEYLIPQDFCPPESAISSRTVSFSYKVKEQRRFTDLIEQFNEEDLLSGLGSELFD